jgi:hypothetical protein
MQRAKELKVCRIGVTLTWKERDTLEYYAERTGLSMSELTRISLRGMGEYLKNATTR